VLATACAFLLFAQSALPERRPSLTGSIEKPFRLESKLLSARDIFVYLPPQYATEPKRRFPVLYMHDGQNVFDGATSFIPNQEWKADEAAEALIKAKLIEPLIIVAVPNAGTERANEYLPTSGILNGQKMGGKADVYGRMLLEELKPKIDKQYRTKPNDSGLAGSSFGGVITLYLGLKHPDAFGKLGVFSPSLFWDNQYLLKQVQALPGKLPLKIWLDMGGAESGSPGQDTMIVGMARKMDEALQSKGWSEGRDLAYYEEGYAPHNEVSWARRFPAMLMFLFPARRG